MRDEESWISGIYTYKAVSVALENALKRRGQKATEDVQEPFLKNWKAKGLSEQEKIAGTKQVFATLEMLKTNFELEKNKGGGG